MKNKHCKAVYTHKFLGIVEINEECLKLYADSPDPTSMFVLHNNQIKEVSKSLVSFEIIGGRL